MTSGKRRIPWTPVLLVVIPAWLILSATVGIWLFFRHEKKQAQIEQERFSQAVSMPLLADDLKKITRVIGERNLTSETAAANLTRAASMIEGLLGPSNTGYAVTRHRGPGNHPLLQITIRGTREKEAPLWIVTSYDSPPGSKGSEANATGLAATLSAAQALAADKPLRSVHFVFVPHSNDTESPVLETAGILRNLINPSSPSAVLSVEAMGAGETLWLTSRDTEATPLSKIDGLGKVVGAEVACLGEDSDLASLLFEFGLPAVRVATRPMLLPGEPDEKDPSPEIVAASAGRLVELIRRLAK